MSDSVKKYKEMWGKSDVTYEVEPTSTHDFKEPNQRKEYMELKEYELELHTVKCIKEFDGFVLGNLYGLMGDYTNEYSIVVDESGNEVKFTDDLLDDYFEFLDLKRFSELGLNGNGISPMKISPKESCNPRKEYPLYSGCLSYFPNALKYVSHVSLVANNQHHPDKPLHWDKNKSTDEPDALMRHLADHSIEPVDDDGLLHIGKVAWRALAMLERYLEENE